MTRQLGPVPTSRKPLQSVRRTGADAKNEFLAAIPREVLATAIKLGRERGWKPTDTFTVLEQKVPKGIRKVAAQDGDLDINGEGRILTWDWDSGDPYVAAGTMIVETYNPSTTTVIDVEYWAGDDWGYTRWLRLLDRRNSDGSHTREASFNIERGYVGLMKAGVRGRLPGQVPGTNRVEVLHA